MTTKTLHENLYNEEVGFVSPLDDDSVDMIICRPSTGSSVKPVNKFYLVTLDMIGNWLLTIGFIILSACVLLFVFDKSWIYSNADLAYGIMMVGPVILIAATTAKWISFRYHCTLAAEAMRRHRSRTEKQVV